MAKTKKYTTEDLAQEVLSYLRDNNLEPEGLVEYIVIDPMPEEICANCFWLDASLTYGGNEGIFLDVYIHGKYGEDPKADATMRLLLFKTLDAGDDAMRKMADLGASCMIAVRELTAGRDFSKK